MKPQALDLPQENLTHVPELDPGFQPASTWFRESEELVDRFGGREVTITILRPDGVAGSHREKLLPAEPEWAVRNLKSLWDISPAPTQPTRPSGRYFQAQRSAALKPVICWGEVD